jgi:hypothetical protein
MSADLSGQGTDRLVGTWKLVSVTSTTSAGERDEAPCGRNPAGFLTYGVDGRVFAMISHDGRKPLSVAVRAEEQAEAFKTFLAYAGSYTLRGEKVIHHIEVSSIQNYVGTDLVRSVQFEGDRIVLVTPPTPSNGKMQTFELIWQRLAAGS